LFLKLGASLEQDNGFPFGIEIDGYSESADPPILCEAWIHCGKSKGGQPHKIMKDALILLFTEKCLEKEHKKILLFCDEDSRKHFTGKSWEAKCLLEYGIKTEVYPLSEKQK